MKQGHFILIALIATLLSACASHQTKTDAKSKAASAIKTSPVVKTLPAKEAAPAQESLKQEPSLVSIDIVGKPLPGGKFAKLKIGMPMKQVEELIGVPDRQWQQATGEESTPYYTGRDSLLVQHTYKAEGMLTFSAEHLLIRILVNRAE